MYLSIRVVIKQTVVLVQAYHFFTYAQKFFQHSAAKGNCICGGYYRDYHCGIDATGQLLFM
jgi:hypothetical protein